MTNTYLVLKERHQKEYNEFPMVFAFSDKQFEEAMEKLGLTVNDTHKIYTIGVGGYIRKTDAVALHEMTVRQSKEMEEAVEADTTGEGFIFDMFSYELANHEYGYTRELDSTLDAVGFTMDEVNASEKLLNGLKKASDYVLDYEMRDE